MRRATTNPARSRRSAAPPWCRAYPILGRVTAGMPILAVEEHIGYVPFEPAASGGKYYALRIRGDSMIGVGIMNDDLVIIRQDAEARDGDIVIALLEDEATCKTLCLTPDGVWLRPGEPGVPAHRRHRLPDPRRCQGSLQRILIMKLSAKPAFRRPSCVLTSQNI